MLLRFIPNRVLPDAITKIMASRSKALNVGTNNAIAISSVKVANGKPGIENQGNMTATNLIGNPI